VARDRKRKGRPTPVGELLASALQGTPAAQRLREAEIWRIWDEAVGPQIASRAQPAAIRNGVLTVTVASAPWLQQLNFLKADLRGKLNALLGEPLIQDIFLKSGNPARPDAQAAPRRQRRPRRLSPQEAAQIDRATAGLDDPVVREALATLFARHLASEPTGDE